MTEKVDICLNPADLLSVSHNSRLTKIIESILRDGPTTQTKAIFRKAILSDPEESFLYLPNKLRERGF